jgi:hypothetical protein
MHKNVLLNYVIEGKIKNGRGGRRRRQLLDDLKGKKSYSILKEEELYPTLWSTRCKRL